MSEIDVIKERIEEIDLLIAELNCEKRNLLDDLNDFVTEEIIYGNLMR